MARVAIIGGGASGLLTAIHILRAGGKDVTVVEPGPLGAGIAYSTTDVDHRLNVPAAGMSALPGDPEHFLNWLRANRDPDFPAGGFARRVDFLTYLQELFAELVALPAPARAELRATRATSLVPEGERWRVVLADGGEFVADDVVLAMGNGVPSIAWAPEDLKNSDRFVADPWAQPVPDALVPGPGGTVLLVGAGLTMADMAISWGRRGATVHVVSRHGLLPLPHSKAPNPRPAPPELPGADTIPMAEAKALVETTIGKYDDWRDGVDSLRTVTAELWRRIPVAERAAWLRGENRYWNRARHRVAPEVGDRLAEMLEQGTLVNHTGTYEQVAPTLEPDVIVNCTGPANAHGDNPFVQRLIADGIVRPHPVGIGIETDRPGLWLIGPMRHGELFETTAIPEIRGQAAAIAQALLG